MTWAYRMKVDLEAVEVHAAAFDAAGALGLSEEHDRATAAHSAQNRHAVGLARSDVDFALDHIGAADDDAESRRFPEPQRGH